MNNVVFVLHFFVVDSCVFGKTTGSVFPRPSLGPVREIIATCQGMKILQNAMISLVYSRFDV